MMRVETPENLLSGLPECLVLSVRHCARHRTVTLVTDFPLALTSADSEREFVALVFHDVVDVVPASGVDYRTGVRPGSVVVHGIGPPANPAATRSARRIGIDFGPSLGTVSFGYGSLTADARGSRVIRAGGHFEYRDVVSGEPFDVHEPFPELDCEA
jgi:hypothetical protein